MTHEQMVDKFYAQYIEWGYDLFDAVREFRMVEGSPDDHFAGGEDEKEAHLFALWRLENELRDAHEARA
jgi:hypothetical protein